MAYIFTITTSQIKSKKKRNQFPYHPNSLRQYREVRNIFDLFDQVLVEFKVPQVHICLEILDLLEAIRDEAQRLQISSCWLQILQSPNTSALKVDLFVRRIILMIHSNTVVRRPCVLFEFRVLHASSPLAWPSASRSTSRLLIHGIAVIYLMCRCRPSALDGRGFDSLGHILGLSTLKSGQLCFAHCFHHFTKKLVLRLS